MKRYSVTCEFKWKSVVNVAWISFLKTVSTHFEKLKSLFCRIVLPRQVQRSRTKAANAIVIYDTAWSLAFYSWQVLLKLIWILTMKFIQLFNRESQTLIIFYGLAYIVYCLYLSVSQFQDPLLLGKQSNFYNYTVAWHIFFLILWCIKSENNGFATAHSVYL